jgi:hypothetical protein
MSLLLPKAGIARDQPWLDIQKTRACVISGAYGTAHESVDPAHIGALGTGIKRGDDETVPVLHRFHAYGHQHGELRMWRAHLPLAVLRDGLALCGFAGAALAAPLKHWRNELPDIELLEALRAIGRRDYRLWKKGELQP